MVESLDKSECSDRVWRVQRMYRGGTEGTGCGGCMGAWRGTQRGVVECAGEIGEWIGV